MTRTATTLLLVALAALLAPATAYTIGFTLVNEANVPLRAVASNNHIQYLSNGESMYLQGDGMVNIRLQRWCAGFGNKGNWADVILTEAEYSSSGAWFRITHTRTGQRSADLLKTSYGNGRKALNVFGQYPITADVQRLPSEGRVYRQAMYIKAPGKVCDGDCADWRRDLCNIAAP